MADKLEVVVIVGGVLLALTGALVYHQHGKLSTVPKIRQELSAQSETRN